ncbi:MAG: hypothetical protein LUG18_09945 [Candidatus Azobacteroides sp.]|nr:hypothetical protein [Candidatus Azobacteroides sp.]
MEEYKPSEKLKEEKGDAIALAMPFHYNRQVSILATKVWSKKRAEELSGKETVLLLAYMSDKGEIKEVTFFLSETTMITPQEISLFEAKLKNLTFELRNNDLEGSNYIMISFNVNFKYLLEKYYE